MVQFLAKDRLNCAFIHEVISVFKKMNEEDLAIKAKKEGKDAEESKKKKKASKETAAEILGL